MPETKNTTVDDLLTPPATEKQAVKELTTKVESVKAEKSKPAETKTAEKKTSATKKSDELKVTKDSKAVEEKSAANESKVTEKQMNVDIRSGTCFEIPKHVRLRVYNTSFTSIYNRTVSGKWYIYANGIVNERVRITDAAYKVEEPKCCCGWVTVESIAKYITRI